MLRFDVVTIFPDFFREAFDYGITRRALAAGLVATKAHDLRNWARDRYRTVDDRPFGGGDGMVLKADPIFSAIQDLTGFNRRGDYPKGTRVVLLSPQGQVFTQTLAADLATDSRQVVLICGRYEGVDERVAEALVTDEISIGDYVLSGGEPAAIVVIDAIVRLLPGALGSETSATNESFSDGLLDYPQYTRPPEYDGLRVPDLLLKGNHAEIARWRREEALKKTERNRPDLLKSFRAKSPIKSEL
jgi:tRNA (guanine37-N1)-methyltransferase